MGDITRLAIAEGDSKNENLTLITADLLIPGRGLPIENGVLVSNQNQILYVGTQTSLPSEYESLQATHVPVLMPGMWDCHVHFLGTPAFTNPTTANVNQVVAGARSARDLAEYLNAGFTSVRECCGYGIYLSKVVDEGSIIGPKIYSCGDIISQTAGHADAHQIRHAEYLNICNSGYPTHLCDGVDECLKATRLQLRKGASFIKICASGGIASELDQPRHQHFSDTEIQAFVDEAARVDMVVAAHCHGKKGIMTALRAGVHTIEHGTELDKESIDLMIEKGAILVPTRAINEVVLKLGLKMMGPKSYQKMLQAAPVHEKAYSEAIKAGVKIALGADLGVSVRGSVAGNEVNEMDIASHGRNAVELKYAVDAGMTPLQAIEAATSTCPETLGKQGPPNGSGQLKKGFDADFIAVSRNPLEDIEVLTDPKNITHVWRHGRLYKSPESPAVSLLLQ